MAENTPTVPTQMTVEELMSLVQKVTGKSVDELSLKAREIEAQERIKAEKDSLEKAVDDDTTDVLALLQKIKVPKRVSSISISSTRQEDSMKLGNVQIKILWEGNPRAGQAEEVALLRAIFSSKDEKAVDLVHKSYGELANSLLDQADFSFATFNKVVEKITTKEFTQLKGTLVTCNFTFTRVPNEIKLASGDLKVDYIDTWSRTAKVGVSPTPRPTRVTSADPNTPRTQEKAPGEPTWKAYFDKRRAAGDIQLIEWESSGKTSYTPDNEKYYFKAYLEKIGEGNFTKWMQLDDPNWGK